MTTLFNNTAFTLIELLVVVLIIGILAAVAVPQYQKAVLKASLTQWTSMLHTAQQTLDMYVLEQGGFPPYTSFTGKNKTMTMESFWGDCEAEDNWCNLKGNKIRAYCDERECQIQLSNAQIATVIMRNQGKEWHIFDLRLNGKSDKAFCQWLLSPNGRYIVDNYPKSMCELAV